MKKKLLTTIGLLVITQGLVACANNNPPRMDSSNQQPPQSHCGMVKEMMFNDMDINSDGFVSKKEANAFHNRKFSKMDTNRDGKLSEEEMENFSPHMKKRAQ